MMQVEVGGIGLVVAIWLLMVPFVPAVRTARGAALTLLVLGLIFLSGGLWLHVRVESR